jgi:hypothetical protein
VSVDLDTDTDDSIQGLAKMDENTMVEARDDRKPAARDNSTTRNPGEEENVVAPRVRPNRRTETKRKAP